MVDTKKQNCIVGKAKNPHSPTHLHKDGEKKALFLVIILNVAMILHMAHHGKYYAIHLSSSALSLKKAI